MEGEEEIVAKAREVAFDLVRRAPLKQRQEGSAPPRGDA